MARAVFIAALAGASLSSMAQQAPAAAGATTTASPAKKELVKKALQLQQAGIESVGAGLANQTANQVMQMTAPAIGRVPEDKRKALVADLQTDVRKFQNDITPILRTSAAKWAPTTLGTALEETFSEEDLKVLIAWLESPVSRKYQQLSSDALQALNQKIVTETRPQVEPKLKALEQAMVAKLSAASGAAPAAPSSSTPPPAPRKDGTPKK
jgi:hypothetical protein